MGEQNIIVIGGGIGGLAAAVEAALGGAQVTLVERAKALGGRGACRAVGDWRLNLGAHALYKAEGLARLRALGVQPVGAANPTGGLGVLDGRLEVMPDTLRGFLNTRLFQVADRWEMARVMGRMFLADAAGLDGVSFADWLDQHVRRPAVRQVLEGTMRVLTYTNAPQQMSAALAIRQLRHGVKGVLYLHGGWQSIVDALAQRAREAGVVIRAGQDVRALVQSGGRVTGAAVGDEVLSADSVILAVPPGAARKLLPESEGVAASAAAAVPSRIASLDLGLRALPHPERRFAIGLDRPMYYSVHSEARGLGPDGLETVALAWYRSPDDDADHRGDLEGLMETVQPGWRAHVVIERYLPALQATTAIPLAARGGETGRVAVDGPELEGVFLVGDWVGPRGHLVDASLASAHDAVKAALALPARRAAA